METLAKEIVRFVARNSERQSALLYPDPGWILHDPHALLSILEKHGVTADQIDAWCVEATAG